MSIDAKEIIFYQEYIGALEGAAKAQKARGADATVFVDQVVKCQEYLNYVEKGNQPKKPVSMMQSFRSPMQFFAQQPKVPERPNILNCPLPAEQLTAGQSVLFLLASYAELARNYQPEKFLPVAFDYSFHAMQELNQKLSASSDEKRDQLAADFVELMNDLARMLPDHLQSGIAIVANSREYEHLMLVAAEVPKDDAVQKGFETFYPVFARVDMGVQAILEEKSATSSTSNDAAKRKEVLTNDDHYLQQNSAAVLQVSDKLSMTVLQEKINQLFLQLYEQIEKDNSLVQEAVVNRKSVRFDSSPVSLDDAMMRGLDKADVDERRLGLSDTGLKLEDRIRGDAILSEVEALVRKGFEKQMVGFIEDVSKGDPSAAGKMNDLNAMIAKGRANCEKEKVAGQEVESTVKLRR